MAGASRFTRTGVEPLYREGLGGWGGPGTEEEGLGGMHVRDDAVEAALHVPEPAHSAHPQPLPHALRLCLGVHRAAQRQALRRGAPRA